MKRRFTNLADIFSSTWLIRREAAQGHFPTVLKMMKGETLPKSYFDADDDTEAGPRDASDLNGEFEVMLLHADGIKSLSAYRVSEFGEDAPPEKAPKNSVAIISFNDVMTKHDQWCGGSGALTKRDLFYRSLSNSNIKGIVFEIDGPGGDGNAASLLYEAARTSNKPVVAFVEGMAASAHLWLACGADRIVMSGDNSEIGSLGSYVEFYDFTKYYEKEGIDVIRIYAPQSTEKNIQYEEALKGNDGPMKDYLKQHVEFFTKAVKDGRPNLSNDKSIFSGAMFFTDAAIKNGLADQKGSLNDAIELAFNLASDPEFIQSKNNNKNTSMALFPKSYPAISALKDVANPSDVQVDAANKELETSGVKGATIVSNNELHEIKTKLDAGEKAALDLKAAQDKITTLTNDNTALQSKVEELGGEPGAKPTSVGKKEDKIEGENKARSFNDYPHNKKALELVNTIA